MLVRYAARRSSTGTQFAEELRSVGEHQNRAYRVSDQSFSECCGRCGRCVLDEQVQPPVPDPDSKWTGLPGQSNVDSYSSTLQSMVILPICSDPRTGDMACLCPVDSIAKIGMQKKLISHGHGGAKDCISRN